MEVFLIGGWYGQNEECCIYFIFFRISVFSRLFLYVPIVTEKVWESESTDATDEEQISIPIKNSNSQRNTLPDPPPVEPKKKQTSLFRFIRNK